MTGNVFVSPTMPRPTATAETPGTPWRHLVRAELFRLVAPRPIRRLLWVLPALVVAFGVSKILTHDTDMAAAWRAAEDAYRHYVAQYTTHSRPVPPEMDTSAFFDDPRYLMAKASFVDLRALMSALGGAAVLFGVIAGGADWSSRVMLTLAAVEPRRGRLFATRALLVSGLCAATALAAALLLLPLLVLAAELNGSMTGTGTRFRVVLGVIVLRGVLYVALMGLLGYTLAMLTRNASAAVAVVFAYVVLGERLFRDYASGIFEYHLSGLRFALLNERPMMPTDDMKVECVGEAACLAMREEFQAAGAFWGLTAYVLPVLLLAA